MQSKTTRAFRTISEAGEELDLQPHVLRFWESKFPQIKPIKRGGGRRFYRPEDIEFLRGIKILLHDEGHPIKDVQKLIRLKGSTRVMELGQSVEKAARDKKVEETVLVPSRIQKSSPHKVQENITQEAPEASEPKTVVESVADLKPFETAPVEDVVSLPEDVVPALPVTVDTILTGPSPEDLQHRQDLEEALERLHALKSRWSSFKAQSS